MTKTKSILSATFFFIISLVMTMDLCCELPKIPTVLAHFSEHQSQDDNTYWQLIMEHYGHDGEGQNHHDEGDHDDLPFHGSHTCQHAPVVFTSNINYSLLPITLYVERGNCEYHFSFSSIYLEAPFQPPQYA